MRYRGSVAVCLVFCQASLMRQAGKGIAIDFLGALALYLEAARRGDPEGQYMQATCYNGARRRVISRHPRTPGAGDERQPDADDEMTPAECLATPAPARRTAALRA